MFGENTRRMRTILRHLRNEATKERVLQRIRYCKKLDYLREKYVKSEEAKLDNVPEELRQYEEASVFDGVKFARIEEDQIEIQIVGNVKLSIYEENVLKLHPKFALMSDMRDVDMELEVELAFAKIRYQLLNEIGERHSDEEEELLREEMTEKEKEQIEEDEARSRQVFDPEGKKFEYRKKIVTDLMKIRGYVCQSLCQQLRKPV